MRRDLNFLLDSSFLGLSPLQAERWLAVSNLLMSVPISAINDVAVRSFIPGIWSATVSTRQDISPGISPAFSQGTPACAPRPGQAPPAAA